MKKTNPENNFSPLEQRLRNLKPKAAPEELSQRLLAIVEGGRERKSWHRYWIPLAAAAALVLCFIGLQSAIQQQESSNTRTRVAETTPTIKEFVKEQIDVWGRTTKILVDGCLEQSPTFMTFKKLREEDTSLISPPKLSLPQPPSLTEHQRKLLEKTDVFVMALASGGPAVPAIAFATPVYVQHIKSEP